MTTIKQHFDDIADFMNIRPRSAENQSSGGHRSLEGTRINGRNWFGVDSLQEVERVMREGWVDGVKRIYEALGHIGQDVQAVSLKRRIVRSDQGDEFDIHRAYSGGLDQAWSRRTRQVRVAGGASITIGVSIAQSVGNNSEEQFWRGAAAVRLADILTDAGYQVRIMAYSKSTGYYVNGSGMLFTVTVKEANQPLDLSAVASIVALAGANRWYGLAQGHAEPYEVDEGNGVPDSRYMLDEADFNITKSSISTREDAERFINNALVSINEKTKLAA